MSSPSPHLRHFGHVWLSIAHSSSDLTAQCHRPVYMLARYTRMLRYG